MRHGLWPTKLISQRKLIDRNFASALERRACLDALGAVVLLLRQAHTEDDREATYGWGEWLWRMLVLLGPLMVRRGVARALADLVEERVMPMASLEGIRFGFPPGHYMAVVAEFSVAHELAVLRRLAGKRPTDWQWFSIGQRLLAFESGWDYRYAFNPVRLIDENTRLLPRVTRTAQQEAQFERRGRLHDWALNMLSRGGHPTEPPDAVWVGGDLWAVDPEDPVARALAERGMPGRPLDRSSSLNAS